MYNVVTALDNQQHTDILYGKLKMTEFFDQMSVTTLVGSAQIEAYFDAGNPVDILIVGTVLDEDDDHPTGIEMVQRRFPAGGDVQVIYATMHPEYITRAYRTQHIYYLLSPVLIDDLNDALTCAVQNLRASMNRPLSIRCDGKVQVVFPCKVSYIESDRRKCHLHVGDEVLTTYATLDSLARELPTSFVRSHKSFLVNMRAIESMDSTRIKLFSGEYVPVSQKRRRATHEAFMAYVDGGRV